MEIIQDISDNLVQISAWTVKGFHQRETNIALFIKLTRKNVKALSGRQFDDAFQPEFDLFCKEYDRLEQAYYKGLSDHLEWARHMKDLAKRLVAHSNSV